MSYFSSCKIMASRRCITLGVALLLFMSAFNSFAENDYGIPRDISTILKSANSKELHFNNTAFQRLVFANKRIIMLKKEIIWFDAFVVANLLIVTKKYPDSRSALTAKFQLAQIYLANIIPDIQGKQQCIMIFKSMIKHHPDAWESIYAKTILASMKIVDPTHKDEGIALLKQLLPIIIKLHKNKKNYKRLVLYQRSIESKSLLLMALELLHSEDNKNAIKYKAMIMNYFKDTYTAKQLFNKQ